jgi:ABC-type polysaccharide/polyol phosphate transport system ATPase subunit
MAHIKLENVGVDFPIFNSSSRSLTNSLVSAYKQDDEIVGLKVKKPN